jgi:hypothetical protein
MARTFNTILIEEKKSYVLFDTGSTRSYVREEFASAIRRKIKPFEVGLGGKVQRIDETCLVNCSIDGLEFDIEAPPIKEIGRDEKGKAIDAIIGALAMEKWGLTPDPKTGQIDLTLLRRREFTEF